MSVDSMFVHKMWNDEELSKMVKGGVPFPMLSDAGGRVGKVYGIYDEDAGVETRGRFIIDPDGVIQGYEVLTPPVGRHVAWHPGRPTLKPGPDLVGKVWKEWKTEMAFD
jgi:alkyl hydroperoxide reductase subunit AhpC